MNPPPAGRAERPHQLLNARRLMVAGEPSAGSGYLTGNEWGKASPLCSSSRV